MVRTALVVALFALCATPAFAKPDVKSDAKPEHGIASIYSNKLVGHRTASGAVLDSHRLTAAHMRLPFGTKVLVKNRSNGREVVVTVNDRGPHRKGRIIDLSPAAAAELGMKRQGLAPVEIFRIAEH
jgi:rare lipoprotein A